MNVMSEQEGVRESVVCLYYLGLLAGELKPGNGVMARRGRNEKGSGTLDER